MLNLIRGLFAPKTTPHPVAQLRYALNAFTADYPSYKLIVEGGRIIIQTTTGITVPSEIHILADRVEAFLPNGSVMVLKDNERA